MRLHQLALVATLAVSVPAALAAQTTDQNGSTTSTRTGGSAGTQTGGSTTQSGDSTATRDSGSTTTQTGSTSTTTQTTSTTTTSAQTSTSSNSGNQGPNHWMASGFIGSNYSNNSATMPGGVSSSSAITTAGGRTSDMTDEASLDFGLSVGYLWHSMVGAEFLAGFTPNFNVANSFVSSDASPEVNTYMVNAVGSMPLGADGRFQPYVSGGFGGITLRGATIANGLSSTGTSSSSSNGNAVDNVFNPDESRAGGNLGAGLMTFVGNWGVRGDVRYFRNFNDNNVVNAPGINIDFGSFHFWRASFGILLR